MTVIPYYGRDHVTGTTSPSLYPVCSEGLSHDFWQYRQLVSRYRSAFCSETCWIFRASFIHRHYYGLIQPAAIFGALFRHHPCSEARRRLPKQRPRQIFTLTFWLLRHRPFNNCLLFDRCLALFKRIGHLSPQAFFVIEDSVGLPSD
jgi:hypothetical protein